MKQTMSSVPISFRPWFLAARRSLRGPWRRRHLVYSSHHRNAVITAFWLVRAYYLFIFYLAFATLRKFERRAAANESIDPLWPILWIRDDILELAAQTLGIGFVIATILSLVWPTRRWPKVLVALFFLKCLAFENSFGSINHAGHLPLWLAICFAGLPTGQLEKLQNSRTLGQQYLIVFFMAQCLVSLFYTLSGGYKVFYGLYVPSGGASSFSSEALSLLVAQKMIETGDASILADIAIHYPIISWPAYLSVIYFELFALVAIFRPELHQLWGTFLMLFHLGVWLLLGISFSYQPMMIALLFLWSPFAPSPRPSWIQVLCQLPVVAGLSHFLVKRLSDPLRDVGRHDHFR